MAETDTLQFDQLKNKKLFLSKLRRHVGEVGLTLMITEELEKANVHVRISGDPSAWQEPGQPAIVVGDHSRGLEGLHFLAACGQLGRNDVSITAKPYSFTGQMANALSEDEATVIGFVPSNMARGRSGGKIEERLSRRLFRKQFPDEEKIKYYNQQSLDKAANLLEDEGRLVTIFPTGGVHNAATTPWRRGVGQIATQLSPETFNETVFVPFAVDGLKPTRIMRAILLSRLGMKPERQDVTVMLGTQETFGEIFGSGESLTPENVTEVLRERYQAEFPPTVTGISKFRLPLASQ
jgi:1-acyl-sn-glycerol-3-phosphate acyltransferase